MSRAAILTALNAPLEIAAAIPLWQYYKEREPDFGQVGVRVICSGICGAQLQEIRGEKGGPLPHLMGHEGCGIVTGTGEGVTRVKAGDKVVLHWRQAAGIESDFPRYHFGGRIITSGRVCTFAENVVVSENRCTPVPADTPPELAALLGCGLSTALGTLENESGLRLGQTLLVIGIGGLGANILRAAKLMHASRIVACDCHAGKGALAKALGADDFVSDLGQTLETFDCVIDTTGNSHALAQGIRRTAPSGRCVMVGQPKPGAAVPLDDARHFFEGSGKTLHATQGGAHTPHLDIPRYVRLWRSGALDLANIITHRLPLDRINDAIDLMRAGEAGRVLIEISPP